VTGLRTCSRVVYRDLWPGIDLLYSGQVNQLKHEFVVQPGADPSHIRLAYSGADVTINEAGELEVSTPVGGFRDGRPYAYQIVDGEQVEVEADFALAPFDGSSSRAYAFSVGEYDPARPLVIDPITYIYCGYIGGTEDDSGYGIAVDAAGNAYVTGGTMSTEASFPVVAGPDLGWNGNTDAFVAKVIGNGTTLRYCGYIGGSMSDIGLGIAVDDGGSAYVTGLTVSSVAQGFPVLIGPDLTYNGGPEDAFVAKVSSDGTTLVYCGYIGGSDREMYGYDIAVDAYGRAYTSGATHSSEAEGFPVTRGPDLTFGGGDTDAYVARVHALGTGLEYCGYIGGTGEDTGFAIDVDGEGNAYVAGSTSSDEGSFPVAVGPDVTYNGGVLDAFVAKVTDDVSGVYFGYCGYIGGGGADVAYGIAVDGSGNAFVAGKVASGSASTFPVTVGPDLTYNGGPYDVFVAKVKADASGLDYCGFIGGSEDEFAEGVDVDGDGYACVVGQTKSSEGAGFPVTLGPDLTYNGGYTDAFVANVKPSGAGLFYCGYIGGANSDTATGVAMGVDGAAYVAGHTLSGHATFPTVVGPYLSYNGKTDAFVARVGLVNHAPTVGAVVPASASGPGGVATAFVTSWEDEDGTDLRNPPGWVELKQCYFHIGATPSVVGNVTLMYNVAKDKLWMLSDDGQNWLGGYAPGSDNVIENGQAVLDCSMTVGRVLGRKVLVGWVITFHPSFGGTKKLGLRCTDAWGAKSGGMWKGTWTITP
jgi:hypothetical protein